MGSGRTAKVRISKDSRAWFLIPALDVHSGINALFETNLTSQVTQVLVSATPGGASRPELSRDGRTLAFVRRIRDKEAVVLKYVVS